MLKIITIRKRIEEKKNQILKLHENYPNNYKKDRFILEADLEYLESELKHAITMFPFLITFYVFILVITGLCIHYYL